MTAATTIDPRIIYPDAVGGNTLSIPEFYDELIRVININAAATSSAATPYVDLRNTYGVTAGVQTLAQATLNTTGINQAIADFSGTGADLRLPAGDVSVEEFNTNRCIGFGTGVSKLRLSGAGPRATTLVQFTVGDLGEQDLIVIDGASDIEICNLGLRQDKITNPDPGQQNHLLCVYNTLLGGVTSNIRLHDLHFGKCIGDALRFIAVDSGDRVAKIIVDRFTMILNGTVTSTPGNGRTGARSGVAIQRCVQDAQFSNFYIKGAQNSPWDSEPTGSGASERISVRNFIIDNTAGATANAMSLGGSSTCIEDGGRIANGYVLGGVVTLLGVTTNFRVDNLTVETTAAMAAAPTDALFQVRSQTSAGHTNLELNNVTLIRRGTSGAGGCYDVINNANRTTMRDLTILQAVNGAPVLVQDSPDFSLDGCNIRFSGANPSSFNAIQFQAIGTNANNPYFNNVEIVSTGSAMISGIRFDQRTPRTMSNIQVNDLRVGTNATNAVVTSFDTRGGSADQTPEYRGIIAQNAANSVWLQVDHNDNPVTTVFPIIAGNRFDVAHHVGVVNPESACTALQGSKYYLKGADQSEEYFKATGAFTSTGWERVKGQTISPSSIGAGPTEDYAPTNVNTAEVIRQATSANAVLGGLAVTNPGNGRRIKIDNISANSITLTHESASSAAANRFTGPGAANIVITTGSIKWLRYDGTSSRWRVDS